MTTEGYIGLALGFRAGYAADQSVSRMLGRTKSAGGWAVLSSDVFEREHNVLVRGCRR